MTRRNAVDFDCATVSRFDSANAEIVASDATFDRQLRGISFPAGASGAVAALSQAVASDQAVWTSGSRASTFDEVVTAGDSAERTGAKFDDTYTALVKELDAEGTSLSQEQSALAQKAVGLNQQAAALVRQGTELNAPVRPAVIGGSSRGTSME